MSLWYCSDCKIAYAPEAFCPRCGKPGLHSTSWGEDNMSEPPGCPTPGACSCLVQTGDSTMSDNERPLHITGSLSVSGTVSHGKLTEELCKFFVAAWDEYCDNPCEEMEWVIQETTLITTKDITEEDMAKGIAPEGHDVGDFMYVLTDLGKEAVAVFCEVNDRRKAELGVVKAQRIPNEVITHPTPKAPEDIVHTWKGIDIETMTHEELVAAFKEAGFAAIAIAKTVFVKPHTQGDAP